MEYAIESAWNEQADIALASLEQKVAAMVADGWQPLGAPSLVFTPCNRDRFDGLDGFTAMQAVQRQPIEVVA